LRPKAVAQAQAHNTHAQALEGRKEEANFMGKLY